MKTQAVLDIGMFRAAFLTAASITVALSAPCKASGSHVEALTPSAIKQDQDKVSAKPKSGKSARLLIARDNSDDDDDDEDEDRDKPVSSDQKTETKTETSTETKEIKTASSKTEKREHKNAKPPVKVPTALPQSFYIDAKYNKKIIDKVDAVVTKRLFSKKLANEVFKDALKKQYDEIIASKNLNELGKSMGKVFAALNSSHCNFVTTNDEMYHFLHSLFSDFNKKLGKGKVDYVGFVTGGKPFEDDQVRYVLDGSPAAKAGLRIGDKILKVNGLNYVGYANFADTAGTDSTLTIERKGDTKTLQIKPEKQDLYSAYCEAMKKSVKIEEVNGKKIGYVHVWCGGRRSFETLDELMEDKLDSTDGLIFDLRDGYGGNSLSDLDRFYREPKAYPDFVTIDRNGKKRSSRYYYNKPMVAIINGGSRSGKELLSFSLKRTGRAKLVGTKTAGAVLAGSISPIDEKASCYVAVLDGTLDGVRLEGVGVTPDIEVDNKSQDEAGYEKQYATARDTLLDMLKK